MAPALDYDALRAQTMGAGNDEAVTVNTRALIDKVLARYSGEWTTLRELLQNAADASAHKVVIRFDTLPSPTIPVPQSSDSSVRLRHVLQHHTLKSIVVENDGEVFKATDWARLKKIAEGNPDETKIGAFGVGFYSVFADCEEPFVSSGREALAFYWKADALFTRSLQLPNGQSTNTTFMLPMRNRTSPVPALLSLCRFLTSSLTFVGLESVELWLDEWKIMTLMKKNAPCVELQIPKEVDRKTRDGYMQVMGVTKEAAQLDARWLQVVEWNPKVVSQGSQELAASSAGKSSQPAQTFRSFFRGLAPGSSHSAAMEKLAKEEREAQSKIFDNLMGECCATLFVHVNKARVQTTVSREFSSELERATKKPPPKYTTVSLLSASYEENIASTSASASQSSAAPTLFDSYIPINGKGRIFIGFTTNQTTGLNVHISTPSVIPTVERESIDLNNRFVRIWNVELLRVAGIVARLSWGNEMYAMREKLSRKLKAGGRHKVIKEDLDAFLPEALFLHDAYDWSETTPSSEVGTLMEEAFWMCNRKVAVPTLSTQGVLPSSQVRIEPEELGFVEGIPALPQALQSTGLVKKLIQYGVITEITVSDIKSELESKALNATQLRRFLEWLGHKALINEVDGIMVRALLNVAVANDDETGNARVLVLADMKTFLNSSKIPAEMPVPSFTVPFHFTKKMDKGTLELLGFEELQLVPWLRWLIENAGGRRELPLEKDITQSTAFACAVLPVISKQWEGLSQSSKATVVELLSQRTIMPTKMGLKKPSEAYFPNVKLFDDLPVVVGLHAVKDKFLNALGVRKTIEIGVVFERLMDSKPTTTTSIPNSASKWSHVDLIKYLTSIRADIPSADIQRLKETKICPAETEALQATQERYLVSELYEPDQAIRRLKLPTLQWPGVYRPDSAEGKFLKFLGLQSAPSYMDLIKIMSNAASTKDLALRDHALRYFVDHHQTKGYAHFNHVDITLPYLPVQGSEKVATPLNVVVNERAAIMGFSILRRDLQIHAPKFGVKQDPPFDECVKRLINNPPETKRNAREVFGYLATRVSELNNQHVETLSAAQIIPVPAKARNSAQISEKAEPLVHVPPRICFLGSGDSKYAEIFDYVDFGLEANSFLGRIGSKHEPSTIELAKLLVREPARIFSVLGDTRYLDLLRSVADSWRTLRKDKNLARDMKASTCLLAYREISSRSIKSDDEEDDDSGVKSWELAKASEIVVIDDIITYNQFKETLLAAPMEDGLEEFYNSLGSPVVGSLLEERQDIGNVARNQMPANKLQDLVNERMRLFLHDYSQDSIKHSFAWVQKNLKVELVDSISLRKSLRGYSLRRKERRSAVINSDKPILYITAGGYDMLEVSQALAPVLLHRAKPQSIFMLEMMLESSLPKLRSRGYNVQRILNEKAKEARIAEEKRKQQLAEEEQQIRERKAAWKETQAQNAAKVGEQQQQMPGIFPDSPDRQPSGEPSILQDDHHRPGPRGFLSGLGKRFGFDDAKRNSSSNMIPTRSRTQAANDEHEDPPPPYAQEGQQVKAPQPEAVTAPHQLQQNLVNAIKASRSHNASNVINQPAVNEVKETQSYCDAKPGQDITYIGSSNDVRIFLSNPVIARGLTPTKFMEQNASALKLFAQILFDCADSFMLKRDSMHIFYDEAGSTIAFNQNKSLFFNYRYFESLHLPLAQRGNRGDAVVYWCVVMAHELAHNLVSDHSAQHSYYTEALVIQYFGKIAAKIATQTPSGVNGVSSSLYTDPLQPRNGSPALIDVD